MKYIRTFITVIVLCFAINSYAAEAETIKVDTSKITKVIADTTTNTSGKQVVKYYFIYDGELVSTSKTVAEKYQLARRHGCTIKLALVKKGNSKRIIIN